MKQRIANFTNGQPTTTSLLIADRFGKKHKHVLRDIYRLGGFVSAWESKQESISFTEPNFRPSKQELLSINQSYSELSEQDSATFVANNFIAGEYIDSTGKSLPMFHITKDGFALLAMGFTGEKALVWKMRFLEAFNELIAITESIRDNEIKRLEQMQNALFEKNPKWQSILQAKAEGKTHKQTCEAVDLKSTDTIRRNLRRMEAFGLTPLLLSDEAKQSGMSLEKAIYLMAH